MKKNKEKTSHKERTQEASQQVLNEEVLAFFKDRPDQSFSYNQLIRQLDINDRRTKIQIADILDNLEEARKLIRLSNGHYVADMETYTFKGRLDFVNPRFGFVVLEPDVDSEKSRPDIWIDADNIGTALDGDTVKVSVISGGKGKRVEGQITEVLERKRTEYVGKIQVLAKYAFVVPDHKRMYQDIYVRQEHMKEAKNGDKVIVRITHWAEGQRGSEARKAEGEVVEVLGRAGANETEMHAILAEFGLPLRFPEEVVEEARKISEKITKKEIEQRRDFRLVTTFTIDPENAKDFDDALSIRALDNSPGGERRWEIGVHIADVTHYVQPGTLLEKEAYNRATSVYLVDRVVPMLPEKLSNELCSLRPKEDKLTFSAVFEMTEEGKILNEWFGRTIIHSDRRFSYEEAQLRLEGTEVDVQPGDFAEEIILLNKIALKLREERFRKGAISFETVEVKFKLDEAGVPLAVYPKIRKDAHKLIEEFMLLANKQVAEYVYHRKKGEQKDTMVYRIHEAPDLDKVQTFSTFVKRFGYNLKVEDKQIAGSLNKLMDDLEGKPEQNVLQSLAIRTMAKARYSTAEIGHFGLAFAHYSHFTSPIRRYPDMMAHRLLQHYLDGGNSVEKELYEAKCKHSSDQEKLAADAERASIKYKQVEFMQRMEDREFDGIVTGVTEFGIFVEIIETSCEGLVRMTDITDDFYELDRDNYRIIGSRTGRIISFGDTLKVKVKDTNLEKRSIDLQLVGIRDAGRSTGRVRDFGGYGRSETNGRPRPSSGSGRPFRGASQEKGSKKPKRGRKG